jgi:hypothetical protein
LCDCRFYSIANSFHICRLELARVNYGRWDVAHVRDPFLWTHHPLVAVVGAVASLIGFAKTNVDLIMYSCEVVEIKHA